MSNPSITLHQFVNLGREQYGDTTLRTLAGYEVARFTGGSNFIYVFDGRVVVNNRVTLTQGMYASVNDGMAASMHAAMAMVVSQPEPAAMFTVGGPIESVGRLRYIDGCTDSLLIAPIKKGDPCLNLLHFPPGVVQTMHTHPSIRIGLVAKGEGECVTPFGNVPLVAGSMFVIHPETGEYTFGIDGQMYKVGSHSFRATSKAERRRRCSTGHSLDVGSWVLALTKQS